jgi:hypothetical protein
MLHGSEKIHSDLFAGSAVFIIFNCHCNVKTASELVRFWQIEMKLAYINANQGFISSLAYRSVTRREAPLMNRTCLPKRLQNRRGQ